MYFARQRTSANAARGAGPVTLVTLTTKDLIDSVADALGQELDALGANFSAGELRLDLGQVQYLSSTTLGKFLALHKQVRTAGGRLSLVNVGTFLYEVFSVTRLTGVLDVRRKGGAAEGRALATA